MRIGIGTCIVALIGPDEIVIGADSLRSFEDRTDEVCKIVQVGKRFFASSGLNVEEDTKFDVQRFCRAALAQGGSIRESLEILQQTIQGPLTALCEQSLKEEPDHYHSVLKKNGVTVVFFGVESDSLAWGKRCFEPNENDGQMKLKISYEDFIDLEHGELKCACLGCVGAAEGADNEGWPHHHNVPDPHSDKEGYIKYVIQWAMDNETGPKKLIGGRINILELKRSGARWLQNELGCAEIDSF